MSKKKHFIFCFLLCLNCIVLSGQELPPLETFSPQVYGAENQNWSISQSEDQTIYIANNEGLLQYNGARWNLYKTPNGTILRSVKVIGNRIYSGCYMDFGFWEETKFGNVTYTSLGDQLNIDFLEDEEIWKITELEGRILFQSLDRIYIYDRTAESFKIIQTDSGIIKMYKVDDEIYFQSTKGGLFKIENGMERLVIENSLLSNNEIVNVFSDNDDLLIETREDGFYRYNGVRLDKWNISSNALLESSSVYNSIRLNDGTFVLGTISKGIILLNPQGDVILEMDQIEGLSNNTVLALFEDVTGNLWLGLDNGVDILNLNSPYKFYKDSEGVLGSIYASKILGNYIYIGTNQGLFFRRHNSNEPFLFIEGTKGQVWSLNTIDGQLFCGHDKGTFLIKDGIAKQIANEKGAWAVKKIPDSPNLLIQGNYRGLFVLQKNNGEWSLRNKIEGFDISSRYFDFLNSKELFVSHEYKGVYKLQLNDSLFGLTNYVKLDLNKGKNSGMVKYNGQILYATQDGIFSYNKASNFFKKDSLLSSVYSRDKYVSGKLINDSKGEKLWIFSEDQLIYIESENLTGNPKVNSISLPSQVRNSKTGYENILFLNKNSYLMGTTDGYMVIDIDNIEDKAYNIVLNSVEFDPLYGEGELLELQNEVELKNNENTLKFKFSVADYTKYAPSQYQYRLIGIYNEWSSWSTIPEVLFENLPHGDYAFEVRAKVGQHLTSNVASLNFSIAKPWYLKPLAITIYFLLFVIVTMGIQFVNRAYYRKQKENALAYKERELEYKELENQSQLMEFKNQSLHQDIENKNRELGISTMNLIKKNEFLSSIKKELKEVKGVKDVKGVIKTIDRNINNIDDWKFFEEAFNNADKDFLKKVKKRHPDLTPNDLKLCAYLRLNLASKEIAPLLNISPRSVEVKRYRLRKKMNLPHEASLTNYILDV